MSRRPVTPDALSEAFDHIESELRSSGRINFVEDDEAALGFEIVRLGKLGLWADQYGTVAMELAHGWLATETPKEVQEQWSQAIEELRALQAPKKGTT